MNHRVVLLRVALALVAAGVVTGVAAMFLPPNSVPFEMIATIILAGVLALGLLVTAAVGGRDAVRRRVAAGGLTVSLVVFTLLIWDVFGWPAEEYLAKGAAVCLTVAVLMVQQMLVVPMRPKSPAGRFARWTGLVVGTIAAALVAGFFCFEDLLDSVDHAYVRVTGAALIIASGGSIAAAMFRFVERRGADGAGEDPGAIGPAVPVALTCPRCAARVEAPSNRDSRCVSCRLRIRVEIEEPRCVCGYLLYRLPGDACPECGRAIPPEDRWSPPAGADPVVL